MDQDQTVPHAPDALLIDVENSSASDLFMAVIPALQLGNINDAGFLFYIAKFRGQLERDSFPPDDQEMDSPAVAFSALSEQMGHPINQAVCSDPETLKTILDRVACWHPKIDDGFQPDWKYTHRADPEEACAKNEAAVAAFLKGMGGLCTLLNDPEYFRAYQTVLRYNTAAVPCPTQHEFEGAKTFMAEEEQRRNIHGIFYRPEK